MTNKVAIITDQHFSVRNDSTQMMEFQRKFYDDIFFPTLKQHGIKTILDLGDTFDRRKYINFNSLHASKEFYFDRIENEGYELHTIVGNHTAYFKSTNRVNTIGEVFSHYNSIHNYVDCTEVVFNGLKVLFIPWINKENYDHTMEMINKTDATVAMGHLELQGFEMYRGAMNNHGYSPKIFTKFDQVFSGHFHHKSKKDNIEYLGAPYPMTWSDYNDPRGFHIYDTSTKQLTFVENPYTIFHKVFYDDSTMTEEDLKNADYSSIKDSYVKLIVRTKDNPYMFDLFVDKLQSFNPFQLQTVEDHLHLDFIDDDDLVDEAQDTLTIMQSYVDNLKLDNKDTVSRIMTELYNEALSEA